MPAPSWLKFGGGQNTDDTQGQFDPQKFEDELKAAHKAEIDGLKADFEAKLAPVNEMAAYLKQQKEENERRVAAQRTQKNLEDTEVTPEMWITDPEEAARRTNLPILQQAQASAAITMRREILGDREYYTGDFKAKVDRMIESQPLHLRANSQVLDNCYKVVLADHMQDILDGKLKKQASFTNFNGNTNGKTAEEIKQEQNTLSSEEKSIAAKFGFTDEQWTKSKQELDYV